MVSELLTRTSADLMESRGGHVPDRVVRNTIHRVYTSPESVARTFAEAGHRFVVRTPGGELVSTILISRSPEVVLGQSGAQPVGPASLDIDPSGFHSIFNFAVARNWRGRGIARALLADVGGEHRSLFAGCGIWARSEPPDHDVYRRLGFVHDTQRDRFFDADVIPSAVFQDVKAFNERFRCTCSREELPERWMQAKLKYFAFTQKWASLSDG